MKIGLNLWTAYGGGMKTLKLDGFDRAADIGYEAVELVYDEKQVTAQSILDRAAEIKERAEKLGLELPSVATAGFWQHNLGTKRSEDVEGGLRLVEDGCRAAEAVGARVLLVVAAKLEKEISYGEMYENAVENLRRAAEIAERHGVVLGVENVASGFLYSPLEYRRFIEDVGSPWVKAYLDVGNGPYVCGFSETWIEAVGDITCMVHVKGLDTETKRFHNCGEGNLDWPSIFRALKAVGWDGPVLVETPPNAVPPGKTYEEAGWEAAAASYEGLKKALDGLDASR